MNIVATGATSVVGTGAVKELLKRGHHVYAVLRKYSSKAGKLLEQGKKPENLTILEEDLGSLMNLTKKIPEPCDVFLHMGWRGAGNDSRKADDIQQESVRDALNAIEAAKALSCRRFLFTGSQAECGIHHSLMGEEIECRPVSPYGKAKLKVRTLAEEKCRSLGLDYGHARIFSTYGPGDHPWSLISTCMETFLKGGCIELGDCAQQWNFLYIDDAGRALANLAEYKGVLMEHGCVYNLGGPMEETGELKGFVEKLHELCGGSGSCRYGVRPPNVEGVVNLIPDIRKMERVVNWRPETGFEQGIRNMLRKL